MGHVASPLALRLAAVSDPPGCKCTGLSLLPQFCLITASLQRKEQRVSGVPESPLLGFRGEDRGRGLCPRSASAQTPGRYEMEVWISADPRQFWKGRCAWSEGDTHRAAETLAGLIPPLANLKTEQRAWLQHHQPKSGCSPRAVICVCQS